MFLTEPSTVEIMEIGNGEIFGSSAIFQKDRSEKYPICLRRDKAAFVKIEVSNPSGSYMMLRLADKNSVDKVIRFHKGHARLVKESAERKEESLPHE